MDQLFKKLEKYAQFSYSDRMLILNCISLQSFAPGEMFIRAGSIAENVGFVVSGVFRYLFYDTKGQEVTSYFVDENEFILNIKSFYGLIPSEWSVQSETNGEVLIIDREAWKMLSKKFHNWEFGVAASTCDFLIKSGVTQQVILSESAITSYKQFMIEYPEISQKVPLGHIASYLGITQSTLSRIRKKLVS